MDWLVISVLCALGLLALATCASFIHLPKGVLRVCDFPRTQITVLAIFLGGTAHWTIGPDASRALAAAWVLAALIAAIQAWHVAPYTPLWFKQSRPVGAFDPDGTLKVLVSNVLQTNDNYQAVAGMIRSKSPDIVLLMEVDDGWIEGIAEATTDYPYRLEVALDNLYGMALYSRLELIDPKCMYMLRDDIPSIMTICRLRNGRLIRLFAIHPEPPLPHTSTHERDAEIIIAGQMAKADPLPTLLTGDLNDVAWSRTTRRFRRLSGLADPRIGRGMFNTFNANWPLLRWPLDHLFHDRHFSLVTMARLDHVGSDHFPIFFEVALSPARDVDEPQEHPLREDIEEAREVLIEAGHDAEQTLAPAKSEAMT